VFSLSVAATKRTRRMVAASIPQVISFSAFVTAQSVRASFPFLFREALLCHSKHGARRSEPLRPRLEWQDERRSFCFPPPVGADIRSRGVKGARPAHISGDSH